MNKDLPALLPTAGLLLNSCLLTASRDFVTGAINLPDQIALAEQARIPVRAPYADPGRPTVELPWPSSNGRWRGSGLALPHRRGFP